MICPENAEIVAAHERIVKLEQCYEARIAELDQECDRRGLAMIAKDRRIAGVEAEVERLREYLADWRDSVSRIMAEPCATDEIHCTCVPMLRLELERLKVENAQLRAEIEQLKAEAEELEQGLEQGKADAYDNGVLDSRHAHAAIAERKKP